MKNSRRNFLEKSTALLAGGAFASSSFANERTIQVEKRFSSNDKVRVGLIGAGIIGHIDLETALKVPGVELAGVADLYDARLVRAREKWGNELFVTRDFRELIARKDIDAVLVCTPDFWHDHISIAAMKAGKHVYCEKPMVHHIEEGQAVINTQKATGKVFQVGSQGASSAVYLEAKKHYLAGAIGQLEYMEASNDRNSANGAWQYTMPSEANAQKVSWDKYLGDAPKHAYEPERYFRWRNYKDYGTGVAGDLVVHLLTELHTITNSLGPNKIFAAGGINYWKDGRDAYDLVNTIMTYPKTDVHPAFNFIGRVNLADGSGGQSTNRMVGTEGVIEFKGDGLVLKTFKKAIAPSIGGYDSLESFPKAIQEQCLAEHKAKFTEAQRKSSRGQDITFKEPADYDARLDHFHNFFASIRDAQPMVEDASFGLRAAAPSLACNLSIAKQGPIKWDPVKMKLITT